VLGDNLDLDRIEASYESGVLRLVVPVAERAKPRRIEIGAGSRSVGGRGEGRVEGSVEHGAIGA
jgi:HSP20 family protein